jgi:hypothetical protein
MAFVNSSLHNATRRVSHLLFVSAELGELRQEFNEMKQLLVHLSKDSQKQLVNEFFPKVGDKADIEWSCNDCLIWLPTI